MTNEDLLSLVDRFNAGDFSGAPERRISDAVSRTTIQIPAHGHSMDRDLYVLRSGKRCVGLVLIQALCNEDIHAVMHPSYRRQGMMRRAFLDAVLPDLAREFNEFHVTASSPEGASFLHSLGEAQLSVGESTFIDLAKYRRARSGHSEGSG